jgi:hypothetical protein
VVDSNDNLRLIEVNTDTGLTTPQKFLLDWTQFIGILSSNNISEVAVVYKHDIQSPIVESLKDALTASAPFIATVTEVIVPGDSIFPTIPEDSETKFILRLAYDETAILDSEYAKGTLNCLKLFVDESDSQSVINFYHSSTQYGSYNTLDTTLTNPSNVPDFVTKTSIELMQPHKFYKLGHSTDDDSTRINDFISTVDVSNNIIQQYHISPENITNGKVKSIRSFQVVYGSNLDICDVSTFEIDSSFNLPDPINIDDSVINNLIASKHYYEFATNYVKCENEGFLGSEMVMKQDGTSASISSLTINDDLQAFYVNGAPETDDFDILRQWSYSGNTLPDGSHLDSSYVANVFTKSTYANDTVSITFDNGAQVYIGGETRVLAYDTQDDYIRYIKVLDLDTDDAIFKSDGSLAYIQTVDIVIFDEPQDFYVLDMQPINNFILETNGLMALLVVHNALFCFTAGTKVTMADGTEKNIEDIQIGDMVMSYNETTNQQEAKAVIDIKQPIHNDLVKYTFDKVLVPGNEPEYLSLTCTHDHPLYVNGLNLSSYNPSLTIQRYDIGRPIGATETGDVVNLVDGTTTELFGLKNLPEVDTQTYIITVEDNHNFYANTILVHNK